MGLPVGIYIITGIMASGKSTVAQLLAEKLEKSVHLHGDIYRKMIVNGQEEMAPDPSEEALKQLLLRYRLTAAAAETYYRAGFTVVVQDNYLGKEAYYFLQQFQTKSLYFITLNPNLETVIDREKERNKTGYHTWEVQPLHQVLMEENPRIGLWIDNSDLTPEETVDAIIERAEKTARISI
ncbi:AAA family ATPase [Gracilibacillus alcaliphilus]|uniref:AAA family ATPase n=1 Tax=Gracilibacillus alcaliphilus TaxID=1401441 RepID=UPI0019595D7E|nr:AAA family ATPase [Gracilibacillus alcaliphilus]MBM7676506.1 cytidylate kinase [Gracilibacillus alcaliphilus]